jgi:hypothetical protein
MSMSTGVSGCTGEGGVILVLAIAVKASVRFVCESLVGLPPPRPAVDCLLVGGAFLLVWLSSCCTVVVGVG